MKQPVTHCSLVFALTIAGTAVAAADPRDWQLKRIFNLSVQDLLWETGDRGFIYDGLRDTDIERALETQLDRIDNMMFIRTLVTAPSAHPLSDKTGGRYLAEDDGCD